MSPLPGRSSDLNTYLLAGLSLQPVARKPTHPLVAFLRRLFPRR